MSASKLARIVGPVLLFLAVLELGGQAALHSTSFVARMDGTGEVGRMLGSLSRARAARQDGREALALAGAGRLRPHATWGWTNNPGVHHTTGGVNTVDTSGRRVTAPPDWQPSSATRIALLGNSFTFGDEVADDETWAWLLREQTGATVLDYGVMGFGLDQMLLRYEQEASLVEVDLVVISLTSLVTLRPGLGWDAWVKPRFTLSDDQLTLHGPPFPDPDTLMAQQPTLATSWILRLWWERMVAPTPSWPDLDALDQALLDRLLESIRGHGAEPVLAWLPVHGEYHRGLKRSGTAYNQFIRWCEDRPELRCVDALPAFVQALAAGTELTRGAHWTPAGHELMASELAEALASAPGR